MAGCSLCKGRRVVVQTNGMHTSCPACQNAITNEFTDKFEELGATFVTVPSAEIKASEVIKKKRGRPPKAKL